MADNHETVLQLLQELGKPAALSDLMGKLDVPERTLNRWLAKLVGAGQVQATGQKRGRRYHLPPADDATAHPAGHPLFSATALTHINRVRQPLITRDPCPVQHCRDGHFSQGTGGMAAGQMLQYPA